MGSTWNVGQQRFRVWIAHCGPWRGRHWQDVPPAAVALAPAGDDCVSAEDAALFVEGFNRRMLSAPVGWWAVAVPVVVRYEGDLRAGQRVGTAQCRRLRVAT